jgi:hypothetical protein
MSLKKEKYLEIIDTNLHNLEDLVWLVQEFIDLNLYECNTLKKLLIWNFNVKIKKEIVYFTGDYFSCSIRVKGLIEKDGDIAEIIERYIKKMILNYATFQGWIDDFNL